MNIKKNKQDKCNTNIKDDQTNNLRRWERREKIESNIISHFLLREGNERGWERNGSSSSSLFKIVMKTNSQISKETNEWINKWTSISTVQPSLWTLFLFTDVHFRIFSSLLVYVHKSISCGWRWECLKWKSVKEVCEGNGKEEKRKWKNEKTMGRE